MVFSDNIIESAVDNAMRHIKGRLSYSSLSDYFQLSSMLERDLMWSAWEKALRDCKGYYYGDKVENAEAAVAACIRAGLDRQEGIRYSNNCYWLLLKNQKYYVFREVSGFTAMPESTLTSFHGGRLSIGLTREAFADFLYSFDEMVPRIREATERACLEVRHILLEKEKDRKIKEILKVAETAKING